MLHFRHRFPTGRQHHENPAAALLSLSFLAASAVAGADASADVSPDTNLDEAELVATLEGGHWRSGDAKGTYRVILRTWASSTSAAASGSSGWPMPGPAAPSQASRRASWPAPAEISNGFWSCGPKRNGLSGVTLTIPAKRLFGRGPPRRCWARRANTAIAAPAAEPRRGRRPVPALAAAQRVRRSTAVALAVVAGEAAEAGHAVAQQDVGDVVARPGVPAPRTRASRRPRM